VKKEEEVKKEDATAKLLGSENLNLAAVRTRATLLRENLGRVLGQLQHEPHTLQWSDVMGKWAVMNMQFNNLVAELRLLLKHYATHPIDVVNQQVAAELPITLSCKLLPEMEREEAELLKQFHGTVLGEEPMQQYEALQKRVEQYNKTLDSAESLLQSSRKMVTKRQRLAAPSAAAAPAAAAANADLEKRLLYAQYTGVGW